MKKCNMKDKVVKHLKGDMKMFEHEKMEDKKLMKKLKIDMHDVMIVLIALAFIFVISVLNEKGICVRGAIAKRNVVIRWVAVYALIMFIIIFGAYGKGYVAVDPIYANF